MSRENAGNFGRGSHWIRDEKRRRIYERDAWSCWACACRVFTYPDLRDGASGELATLDHVIPRCDGGTNWEGNLATMCDPCNVSRGNKPAAAWALDTFGEEAGRAALARLLARITQAPPKHASSCSDCAPLAAAAAE